MNRALTAIALLLAVQCTLTTSGTGSETQTGNVAGVIGFCSGGPVSQADVALYVRDSLWLGPMLPKARTDSGGRYRFDSIEVGPYFVCVNAHDTAGLMLAVEVLADTTVEASGTVARSGAIEGRLDSSLISATGSTSVALLEIDLVVPVDSTGRFVVASLPAYDYTAVVLHAGEPVPSGLDSTVVTVTAGDTTDIVVDRTQAMTTFAADTTALKAILAANGLDGLGVEEVADTANGRITGLNLAWRSIDALPDDIGQLCSLVVLDLAQNRLTSLPPAIGQLVSLEVLKLGGNPLSVIPAELTTLPKLRELEMWSATVTALPVDFGNLQALERLYIGPNTLHSLPASFGNLRSLREFEFMDVMIGLLPTSFCDLQSLERFTVTGSLLWRLPDEFGNLSSLRELLIVADGTPSLPVLGKMSGLPASFVHLSSLQKLVLRVGLDTLPDSIARLTGLAYLDLGGNALCSLPPAVQVWADSLDSDWREGQSCPTP